MSTYESLRTLVGVWGLLFFGTIFIVATAYALWPSKQASFDAAARIPLRED